MSFRNVSRRRRMGTHTEIITVPERATPGGTGVRTIVAGFATILITGTVMLSLPIASASGDATHPFDALFTAVSSICVTGLIIFETQEHWTFFGELVIIVLIQIGGLGYMVGTAFAAWLLGRRLEIRDRNLLRLYYGAPTMGETLNFARNIALYTLAVEFTGAVILYFGFLSQGVPPTTCIWWSIFHSVSAFNNAGFTITGFDLLPYQEDPVILIPIAFLVILGGLGALPIFALGRDRSFSRLPLDFKVIFVATGVLLLGGTLLFMVLEWSNELTVGAVDPVWRPMVSFFLSTTPRTAGFAAIDNGSLRDQSMLLTIVLMFIGGATGSTAGGIKVGTFALLVAVAWATVRGRDEGTLFNRRLPRDVAPRALAIVVMLGLAGFACVTVLAELESIRFIELLFETTSALGTVGLSTGITPELTDGSRAALIVTMLTGRFGSLLLLLYVTRPHHGRVFRYPVTGIRLG